MKKAIYLTTLALGAAACGHETTETHVTEQPPANAFTVEAESLPTVVAVDGNIEAKNRASLSTRMMARVSSIPVEVGDRVRAGQTLIRLGTEDISANRAKADAAVMVATAARDEAARHAARMDTLLAQDAVPRVQRDGAFLGLTQAESQLAMAEASLTEVENANRYANVRAPFDGSVVARHINVGDLAAPGMPLIVIDADGPREAVIAVPADIASHVSAGSFLTVSGSDGVATSAEVTAVASGADPWTRTVQVRATVPSDWGTGVAVTALVPTGSRSGISIPESAVVRRGQLTGVRVLTDMGEQIRWVRLGRTISPTTSGTENVETRIEVLSGLEAGERIVR
ncbi:efflux RND transporter periplasmic adaptor subunit [Gemmatimonadota bacterium]